MKISTAIELLEGLKKSKGDVPCVMFVSTGPETAGMPCAENEWFNWMKPLVEEIADVLAHDTVNAPRNRILLCREFHNPNTAEAAHQYAARLLRGSVELPPFCQSYIASAHLGKLYS